MTTLALKVRRADVFLTDCRTRLPFRFGAATMTHAPLCLLRAEIETDSGRVAEGFSSDLLVPKWFDKNPDTTTRQDLDKLLDSVRKAIDAAVGGNDVKRAQSLA